MPVLENIDPVAAPTPIPTDIPTRIPTHRPTLTPTSTPYISEDDLWQALTIYRQAQQRTSLVKEEPLCAYARKRVAEHEERLKTLKSGENPLDAHAGFQRDADSGGLFTETGFSSLAENLAYLPTYATATSIIEWGWDSSTSHRSAQLSNDWTHACVVGTFPFYVGIFGKR